MDETRKCPYCAEEIRAEAIRCPYCRSRIAALDPARWFRDHPERRLAGVTAAIAHAVALPVTAVRVGFVVATFVHFLGPIVYGALWLLIPFHPGDPSPLAHLVGAVRDLVAGFGGPRRTGAPPADRANGSHLDAVSGEPLA